VKLTLVLSCVSAVALASAAFPQALTDKVMPKDMNLSCDLCHKGVPSKPTVTQPFSVSLKAKGAIPEDVEKLNAALDALATEKIDSDKDGVDDITELKNGTNPNKADAVVATDGGTGGADGGTVGPKPTDPGFGCSVTGFPVMLGAIAGFVLARRRRK
jgi:N-acetylmuramoyl-L-alanine amidase